MHEHLARFLYYLGVHFLYASLVWLAAWALTSIRRGSATTKYWIWVATTLNFVVPLGAVFDKVWASHLSWATPLAMIGDAGLSISRNAAAVLAICVVWSLGVSLMVARLCLRLRAEHCDARDAGSQEVSGQSPGFFAQGVPVRFAGKNHGPAVDGLLRPRISLPSGIEALLSKRELDAVLIHEVAHARRRDNLIRLVHEVGLCALWFHPFIWITGSRLALYRELSCDEPVIETARGGDLVSALAKIARLEEPLLLQSTASSFLGHRLARLATSTPERPSFAADAALALAFLAVLLAGVLETVSHTACCFLVRG